MELTKRAGVLLTPHYAVDADMQDKEGEREYRHMRRRNLNLEFESPIKV